MNSGEIEKARKCELLTYVFKCQISIVMVNLGWQIWSASYSGVMLDIAKISHKTKRIRYSKTPVDFYLKIRKTAKNFRLRLFFGGDKRDRTADLLTASQALSQLSYTPK